MTDHESTTIVRDRLKQLFERDDRTITDIAKAAGIHRQLVYQILSGKRPNPSIQTMAKLLAALKAHWRDLD